MRIVLAFAAQLQLPIYQFNVKFAFLNGNKGSFSLNLKALLLIVVRTKCTS